VVDGVGEKRCGGLVRGVGGCLGDGRYYLYLRDGMIVLFDVM